MKIVNSIIAITCAACIVWTLLSFSLIFALMRYAGEMEDKADEVDVYKALYLNQKELSDGYRSLWRKELGGGTQWNKGGVQ